jgi:hypothetical protein
MRLWQKNTLIALAMILMVALLILVATEISHASGEITVTIQGSAANLDMAQITDSMPSYNYGAFTSGKIGKEGGNSKVYGILYYWNTLKDTLRIYSTKQIDSAKQMNKIQAVGTAGDSVFASLYPIKRAWSEGLGTSSGNGYDTCGASWDSANATHWGGCSGTAADWGTDGCNNTTSDRSSTREVVTGHPDSTLFTAGPADNNDTLPLYISGVTIGDTNNCKGWILIAGGYGGNDGVQSIWTLFTDDAAGNQPYLVLYLSDKPGGTIINRLRRAKVQQ